MSELELKFEVSPQDLKRLTAHPALAGAPERVSLSTVYFDTPDGDLRAAGLSLRVRRKAGKYVQTLKRTRSSDLFDRDEWEAETSRFAPNLSLLADTPVAELLDENAMALRAQFSLKVNRQIHLVQDGDTVIEVSVDRGEVHAGDLMEPLLELELELKEGSPERLYAFAETLFAIAPIRLSFDTKSDRGHRLVSGALGDARKAEALSLTPKMSTQTAFRCIARACLVQLAGNTQALHRERRPEALHQARIALRRLRSAMSVFRSILRDGAYAGVRAELKWAAGELDLARDLDVFIGGVEAAPDAPGKTPYLKRLSLSRGKAYDQGLAALDTPRFAKLLLDAALWVETGEWTRHPEPEQAAAREQPVADFACRVLDDRRRRLKRVGKGLEGQDPEARHQVRIEAKKLRYAAEFLENAFPDAAKRRRRFIEALKALQDALGALNDIAVGADIAHQSVTGSGAMTLAFTAGEIVGGLRAGEERLIARTQAAFEDFRDVPRFWRG